MLSMNLGSLKGGKMNFIQYSLFSNWYFFSPVEVIGSIITSIYVHFSLFVLWIVCMYDVRLCINVLKIKYVLMF